MGASTRERESKPYRADIQGLRAVAVLAVVFYHAHVGALSGGFCGVDVFFVISGFLITDLLWRELADKGRISLKGFYARRARRLLPAAMLVLVATMLASLLWLPPLQVSSVWKDGVATALYGGNYRFAFLQTNYLTSSLPPSPFQQYWSLGVEEQFYLVWPLLLLLSTGLLWRRSRRRPSLHGVSPGLKVDKKPAVLALAIVAVTSFGFSVWLTQADQPWAFFSLPSRAWELAVGGLIALGAPVLGRLPAVGAALLGWAGLAGVVASVLCLGPFTPFPGWAALGPVAGAAGVVAGGLVAGPWGPVALLGRLVMRGLGDLSYSWYLWHWPVLVLAPTVAGHSLSEAVMVELAIGSGVLAWVTYELVEQPARRWSWLVQRPRRALFSGLGLSSAGVATCLVAFALMPSVAGHGVAPVAKLGGGPITQALAPKKGKTTPAERQRAVAEARLAADQHKLALIVKRSAATTDVPANLQPPLAEAADDEPFPYDYGCLLGFLTVTAPPCAFGDVASPKTVVIFGDSHAMQWFPALDKLADARRWRLIAWAKATCPPLDIPLFSPDLGRPYTECSQFVAQTMARIEALHPMLVVLGMAPNYDSPYGVVQDGRQWLAALAQTVSQLRATGARVLVMGPVESPSTVVPDCLSGHLDDVSYCDVQPTDRHEGPGLVGYDNRGQIAEQQAVVHAGGHYVDVKPWFCAATTCPVIVGNLLVFRDNNHITATYSAFLYPVVSDEVDLYFPPVGSTSGAGRRK